MKFSVFDGEIKVSVEYIEINNLHFRATYSKIKYYIIAIGSFLSLYTA